MLIAKNLFRSVPSQHDHFRPFRRQFVDTEEPQKFLQHQKPVLGVKLAEKPSLAMRAVPFVTPTMR